MTLCREWTKVKRYNDHLYAEPLKCRSWQCEHCHPHRCRELKALARSGNPDTFITLTCNPKVLDTPDARAQALVAAWRTVLRRAKKKYKYKSIPFLAVFEKTKRGEPHLHILCRVKWIDQQWLSDQMRQLIGAPIVDIRRVRSKEQSARYVSKYVGKDPERFKGCKRYWRSQDYQQPDDSQDATDDDRPLSVEIAKCDLRELAYNLQAQGYFVDHNDTYLCAIQVGRRR